jgi:hypothetical protein
VQLRLEGGAAGFGEDVLDGGVRGGLAGEVRAVAVFGAAAVLQVLAATPVPRPSVLAYIAGEMEPTCDCMSTRCRVYPSVLAFAMF